MTEKTEPTIADRPGVMFIHSCHVPNITSDGRDAVVVKEKIVHPDGTTTPNIRVIRDPKVEFGVTKKGAQTHEYKKEAEQLSHLNRYVVPAAKLPQELAKVLYGYIPRRPQSVPRLCNSPYVYGADISAETHLKARYQDRFAQSGRPVQPVTTGVLDVETSVFPGNFGELTIISVTHEHKVYTAVVEHAFYVLDTSGKRHPGKIEDLARMSHEVLTPKIAQVFDLKTFSHLKGKKLPFEFEYYVGKTPADILHWVFGKIHTNHTDFVGGWNIDYDLNTIFRMCKDFNIPPEDLFCHPSVPRECRYVRYALDNKDVPHFTRKWHWLHSAGTAQFYDAMCLYSVLRTVTGFETSYKLDDILEKNIGVGKLSFPDLPDASVLSDTDWHRHMQSKESYRYIIYNQWDVISVQLMEWKNTDVQSMYQLSGVSPLSKYTRQTRKAADTIYFEWLKKGVMLAAPGAEMGSPWDKQIGKVGGAVLRPELMDMAGMHMLTDAPGIETMMHPFVNDVDFSAMYPTVGAAMNISKETKRWSLLSIDGKRDDRLYSLMVSTTENAVHIGATYFGLPNYSQMSELFSEHRRNTSAS